MDVSIVIVSYNTSQLLHDCLSSLYKHTSGLEYEVFVVDNASEDGSAEMVKELFPDVLLIENSQNRGFAAANNQALALASGRYMALLNSDTELRNNAFAIMCQFMNLHPEAAATGPRLLNSDGSVQMSIGDNQTPYAFLRNMVSETVVGHHLYSRYDPGRFSYTESVRVHGGYLTGACLVMRREAISSIGLLDETFFFAAEDADWCLRASRAGWSIWYLADPQVKHHRGASGITAWHTDREISGAQRTLRQQRYFVRKHYTWASYAAFRILTFLLLVINVARRVFSCLTAHPASREERRFKLRKAKCMLRTSLELRTI